MDSTGTLETLMKGMRAKYIAWGLANTRHEVLTRYSSYPVYRCGYYKVNNFWAHQKASWMGRHTNLGWETH